MATRTIANGGGNWNSNSTWVEGVFPVAGDNVVATGTSGNLTVTAAAAAATVDFSNYTGKFTINSAQTLTLTSTLKFVSGMTVGGSGSITINGAGATTLTSGGLTLPFAFTITGTQTYTLADDWHTTGNLSFGNGSAQSPVLNGNTWFVSGGTMSTNLSSGTISGTTLISLGASMTWTRTSGTVQSNLNFDAGAGTITLAGITLQYGGGTITYVSGTMSVNAANILSLQSSCTLALGSSCHLQTIQCPTSAITLTLGADLYADNQLHTGNANFTFAGAFDAYLAALCIGTVNSNRVHNFVAGQTYTLGTSNGSGGLLGNTPTLPAAGIVSATVTLASSVPTTPTFIKILNGCACMALYVNGIDIDSSGGLAIISPNATIGRTVNWQNGLSTPVRVWPSVEVENPGVLCG